MDNLWLVCFDLQQKEISQYCYKDCGKAIVGAVILDDFNWLPCRTEKCPYLDKESIFGESEVGGNKENVILRKLKELPK